MKSKKNAYQLVLVVQPKLPQKDREGILAKVAELVKKDGVEVGKEEEMGTKELAYEIKGQNKGDFWKVDLSSDKTFTFSEVNLFLNREAQVIRYLVLKK